MRWTLSGILLLLLSVLFAIRMKIFKRDWIRCWWLKEFEVDVSEEEQFIVTSSESWFMVVDTLDQGGVYIELDVEGECVIYVGIE